MSKESHIGTVVQGHNGLQMFFPCRKRFPNHPNVDSQNEQGVMA